MKTKVIVAYSTNRDETFQSKFCKEITKSIGCYHDIIPYYNDGKFSLTQVYNIIWNYCIACEQSGIDDSDLDKNVVLVFIHHDIHFKNKGWGKTILNLFNTGDVDILGVAGTQKLYSNAAWWLNEYHVMNQHDLFGKVWHTDGKKEWKSNFTGVRTCKKLQPVVTVDGLFIAVDPDTCEQFDEEFGYFHFYDTSFCVRNFLNNKRICVTETIPICHESGGVMDVKWEENRLKFCIKYADKFPIMVTK
jgi:hypothetical protein